MNTQVYDYYGTTHCLSGSKITYVRDIYTTLFYMHSDEEV